MLGSGQNSPLILHYSAIQHQTAGAGRVLVRDDAGCMVVIAMWPGGGVHQLWPATMVPARFATRRRVEFGDGRESCESMT